MNTDYWCFGSRYPRSTRNNNPLIHLDRSSSRYTNILQHGKSFSSKNLCNFDRETNKVGSGFLIFLQRSILFFILQGWFDALSSVTRHFFPLSGSRSCLWSIASSETDGSRDRVELAETVHADTVLSSGTIDPTASFCPVLRRLGGRVGELRGRRWRRRDWVWLVIPHSVYLEYFKFL